MLIFILVATAIIIGGSILVGRALSGGGQPRGGPARGDGASRRLSQEEKMNMLKASGALKHRKSNR